jgi:hypothetical protein
MNFCLLGEHEDELLRQFRHDALGHGEARATGGDVAQVAGADRFAAVGANHHVPA